MQEDAITAMIEISVLARSPLFTVTIESGLKGAEAVYFHAGEQGFGLRA
jgi:hypothetical protein